MRMLRLLAVGLLAIPAFAAPHVWTGAASDRFSNAANWIGGTPAGDSAADLSFPAGARLAANNDLSGLTVRSIALSGAGYSVAGNPIVLLSGASLSDSTFGPNTIANDLSLSDEVLVSTSGYFGTPGLALTGALSGSGGLSVYGGGNLVLAGSAPNTYTGATRVFHGELQLEKPDGVAAFHGPVIVSATGADNERGYLGIFAAEQIPDDVPMTIAAGGTIGFGAEETIGPLTLERGGTVRLSTNFPDRFAPATGRLIFAGDIRVEGTKSNTADLVGGPFLLPATRTLLVSAGTQGARLMNFSGAPGAGLTITSDGTPALDVSIAGDYDGPTIVEAGIVTMTNPHTPVMVRGGSFSGSAASLTGEGGEILGSNSSPVSVAGSVTLSASVTVTLSETSSGSPLRMNGTLTLGNASFRMGCCGSGSGVSTIISNESSTPTAGTFANLPEGSFVNGAWRISYVGGDGNDVTLTPARGATGIDVSRDRERATVGEPVTLTAQIRFTGSPAPTGTVTFVSGTNPLATAPVVDGVATAIVTLPIGVYPLGGSYSGDAHWAPSKSVSSQSLFIVPKTPTITATEPASMSQGQATTLTIRGTEFLQGASVGNSYGEIHQVTFLSSTEMRVDFVAPASDAEKTAYLRVYQPGPGGISSDLYPLPITAPAPVPSLLRFDTKSVTAPVTPNATTVWLSVTYQSLPFISLLQTFADILPDSDGDGFVTRTLEDAVPSDGIWTVMDLSARTIMAGKPPGVIPQPLPFPPKIFLHDENGRFTNVIVPGGAWNLIWGRPGVGAWLLFNVDGSPTGSDLDQSRNGLIVFKTSQFMTTRGVPPPSAIEPGDLFLGVDSGGTQWFGDRVEGHLSEGIGPGRFLLADQLSKRIFETAGNVKVAVVRRDGADGVATVNFTTLDDTGVAGKQYLSRSGTLRFEQGEIVKFLEIPVLQDFAYSEGTFFRIAISDPVGATLGEPTTIRVPLFNVDPQPTLSVVPMTVAEGDTGIRTVTMKAQLTGGTLLPVTATWRADTPDVVDPTGSLRFEPGETEKKFDVPYPANTTPEPDRTIPVGVYPSSGASAGGTANLTIVDDDFATLTIDDASVREGDSQAVLHLRLSRQSFKPVTGTLVFGGTATAGSDYSPWRTFSVGGGSATSSNISIPIVNDSVSEGLEFITVTLNDVQNGRVARSVGVVTIVDDDTLPFGAPAGVNATASSTTAVNVAWIGVANATSYEIHRSAGNGPFVLIGTTAGTAYADVTVAPNAIYRYKIRALGSGGAASAFSAPDAATTMLFTDVVLAGTTVRALHLQELRSAIAMFRAAAGLKPFVFTDPSLTAGTMIRATHIQQLRSALEEARAKLDLPLLGYSDDALAGGAMIKAVHIEELRAGCR